jgi:transitional endoplasmic reticulum ATPase
MKGEIPDTTFEKIKGLEEVKRMAKSFIFMAKNTELLKKYKIEGGLGLLLYGAPGTGKTMFAEAIANEMKLPLFIVTPADIFKSYVGESEQAVKQLFMELDACPDGAILFIDECESIFSRRTQDTKDYKAAVTTELLQRINGFGVNGAKRIMIAATNRPDVIDPAYLRYKRFSHLVHVTPPDKEAKKAIIEGKVKGIELHGITTDQILEMTEKSQPKRIMGDDRPGYYSAADICGIIEEACRLALEEIQASGKTEPIPLTKEMFVKAFKKTPPSISQELLDEYNNFRSNIND